jgi:hypothetical protein
MRTWFIIAALVSGCAGVDGRLVCKVDDPAPEEMCLEGYACDATSEQCLKVCTALGGCIASEYCDIEAGETDGVCRFGSTPGTGDPAPGD